MSISFLGVQIIFCLEILDRTVYILSIYIPFYVGYFRMADLQSYEIQILLSSFYPCQITTTINIL